MEERSKKYFVTAIGTDSGKTLVSAILACKWNAAYWKPIQCGFPGDSAQMRIWLGEDWPLLPETHTLKTPASPHFAAKEENIHIGLKDFKLPQSMQNLVVEGAGGLLVPLNEKETMADLISYLKLPVVLVVNHYLGSINHSLLTLSEIRSRKIPLAGIVFNGTDFQQSEVLILDKAQCRCILRINRETQIDRTTIHRYANLLEL